MHATSVNLESSVNVLAGVGPKIAEKLANLGIERIVDLLFHLPLRYQDRTRITPINQLRLGQDIVIQGKILSAHIMQGRRRSLLCTVGDTTGQITLRFFHFNWQQQQSFVAGTSIRCFGEIRSGFNGAEMVHPEYRLDISDNTPLDDCLTPIYPSTDGIHQKLWRSLQAQALSVLRKADDSSLELVQAPKELAALGVSLKQALQYLHQPPADADLAAIQQGEHPFQRRLAFEELLAHQLSLLEVRSERNSLQAPELPRDSQLAKQLIQSLPFELTQAQKRTIADIQYDCSLDLPMQRLVQGDVGSGKTVVAAVAAAQAVEAGYQVAIMAPTEILAEQHRLNFEQWFAPLNIRVEWLVGKHTAKQKEKIIARLQAGEIDIVLGTHAIFQAQVKFHNLGLVIIDEQHRFGVHQRLALRDKGAHANSAPHQLIMTATPIPRTLAMTAYADLDLSVINELPPGRTPINTVLIEQTRREQVIERVNAACLEGHQAYWVCTLIEESEVLNCQAAEKTAETLQQSLPQLRIGLVHGRLKAAEKAEVMQRFSEGEIDVLVATTVIEVGVNVPNASIMVIENPERLGLAQLHQLRGRVGRGSVASHCVLLYQAPLSQRGKARLRILRETNDGFKIAETDLELRGPGEVLGSRQTGLLQFRVAELERDGVLLPLVQQYAKQLFCVHSPLIKPLIKRWIYNAEYYAQG